MLNFDNSEFFIKDSLLLFPLANSSKLGRVYGVLVGDVLYTETAHDSRGNIKPFIVAVDYLKYNNPDLKFSSITGSIFDGLCYTEIPIDENPEN